MKQRDSSTICSVTGGVSVPQKDANGDIYGWQYESVETGDYEVALIDPTDEELEAIGNTVVPGHKRGIQSALERLAQIKPIGRSEVKQSTVIGYLSFDMFEEGISEFVVNELCKEYRQSEENRFFPDSAEFLNKAKRRMKKYQAIYQAQFPKPEPEALPAPEPTLKQTAVETQKMPWGGMTLDEMPENVMKELENFCIDFASERISTIYCRTYGINYKELKSICGGALKRIEGA